MGTWAACMHGIYACLQALSGCMCFCVPHLLSHTHIHTQTRTHTYTHTHTHIHKRILGSLMSGICSPSDTGDLAVCNGRSLDVLWHLVRGGPVRTCRVQFRCQNDMHRLPRR